MDFWQKPLSVLDDQQWEALCDGCGRCCMHKFEDADSGEMLYTDVACRLFDATNCRCSDYENRMRRIPECLSIRDFSDAQYSWLPASCAYRLRHEGKPLPDWHPLLSGDVASVQRAGVSVQGHCLPEFAVSEAEWPDRIIEP